MRILVKSQGFSVSDAIRAHVERRILFAFSRFAGNITVVTVRLDDINGPKSGVDKRCRIEVNGARLPRVMNDDIDADLYVAINRSVERAGRAIARALARRRERDEAESFSAARSLVWIEARAAAG